MKKCKQGKSLFKKRVQKKLLKLETMEKNLPKEKALEMAKRIRPVMTQNECGCIELLMEGACPDGVKHWVEGNKIYNQSYVFSDFRLLYGRAENLKKIATIKTYHKLGFCGLLKPSAYEVLYQIPKRYRNKVVAFELYAPADTMEKLYDADLKRHVLTCVLYSGTIPQSVAEKEVIW